MSSAGTKALLKTLFPAGAAGAALGMPEDAEAAIRPDILDVVRNAIKGQKYAGKKAGTLESRLASDALTPGNGKYKGNQGYFTDHGLTWRNSADNWSDEQTANAYRGIYNSTDTVTIPNVLGVNPSAQEALWNPMQGGKSLYMPIVPYKKGFKGISIYDPEAQKVENLLKSRGYWDGGSDSSSIFTPTLEVGPAEQVGSGTLSAVNNRSFGTTLGDLFPQVKSEGGKNVLKGLLGAGGATAASTLCASSSPGPPRTAINP